MKTAVLSFDGLSSELPLLKDNKWDADKQYKVASNVKCYEEGKHIGQELGSVVFKLLHSAELPSQYIAGNLLANLSLSNSKMFRNEISKITKEVFEV